MNVEKMGAIGYTVEMRYFLPLADPWNDEAQYSYGLTGGYRELQLGSMPKGFTPGEYAFCIVKNLSTSRAKPKSLREDGDEMYCRAQPVLAMSALMEHLQRYAKENCWKEDDAESALHAMVRNAPEAMAKIQHDAKDWPFSGDQCFLAWTSVLVQKSMLMRDSISKSQIADLQWDKPDIDMATHLGRWFAQRPYLSEMAHPIVKHLVRYVQTIASMPERDYFIFSGRHDAKHVMQCEVTADNGVFRIVGMLSNVPRPVCLEEGYVHQWSDKDFGAFVLGMGWEMRAQGEGLAFERLNALLNKGNTCTSNALALLQWEDIPWRNAAMERIVEVAQPSIHAMVQGDTNMAFLELYPQRFHWRLREARHNEIVKACLAQDPRSQWTEAVFKLAVASALRETFLPSSVLDYDSHGRVQAMAPLLKNIDPEQRNAMFVQFVQAIEHVGNEMANGTKKHPTPWTSFARRAHDAWLMSTGEDAPEDQYQPEVAYMVEWLSLWKHPFEQNFKVLSTIAPDMETLGLHLQQWVEQRSRSEQIHTMEEMPVDGMFD